MVAGYDEDNDITNGEPGKWHALPDTTKVLSMFPLPKDACERHTPHGP